jgi:hypothetical protein
MKSFKVEYRFDYRRGLLYEGDDIIFRTSLTDNTFSVTLQEAEAEATSKYLFWGYLSLRLITSRTWPPHHGSL